MSMCQWYNVWMYEQYNIQAIHHAIYFMSLKCDVQFYFFLVL
jgi:hypothetical protein